MKALNPSVILLGTPWTMPAWMQRPRKSEGSAASNTMDHQYDEQFALYLVKYLQTYQGAGVRVDAISIQNEPSNNEAGNHSMSLSAAEASSLIRDHIASAMLYSKVVTDIWINDQNTGRFITFHRSIQAFPSGASCSPSDTENLHGRPG
jgi:glucosylceramidase